MGSCSWGMADLARHERQNTAYPPQTAPFSESQRFGQVPTPQSPLFLVQDSDPPTDLPALGTSTETKDLRSSVITPRKSSASGRNVSASSISSVGRQASTTRKIAAAVTFAVGSGSSTMREITSSRVVFPHRCVAERIASRGEIMKQSRK